VTVDENLMGLHVSQDAIHAKLIFVFRARSAKTRDARKLFSISSFYVLNAENYLSLLLLCSYFCVKPFKE